jgi:hypothetical protein
LLNTFLLLSSGVSLKYNIFDFIYICNVLPFISPRVPSIKRIGPHNLDILSILIGSLLGDGTMEKDSRKLVNQDKKFITTVVYQDKKCKAIVV